jgi:hypothetical protein
VKPYTDEFISNSSWVRTFNPTQTNSDEYIWHRDEKDRVITVLSGDGWGFQIDNELPETLNRNEKIFVPKMVYHRLLIGHTELKIKIEEV